MNASIQTLPASTTDTKPLWAAVGVLSVMVLAMGASLVYVQTRPVDAQMALATSTPAVDTTPALATRVPLAESLDQQDDLVAPPPKPMLRKAVPAKPTRSATPVAPVAPPPVAVAPAPAPAPVVAPAAGPMVTSGNGAANGAPMVVTDSGVFASTPVARPPCASCGTIESVTPVERKGTTHGVGAVAGGLLGAVVGHQIGNGSGRTAATILGAIGGGFAGNAVEKNVKKETAYQVRVRMEDGSTRTVEQAAMPVVGARVTVDGGVLQPSDGSHSAAPAGPPQPQAQFPQSVNRS